MLLKFVLNNSHGQLGCINRGINIPQHIGQGSDVILMSMSNNKPFHFFNIIFKIGHIGNHQINPQHIVLGKGKTAVHNNNTVFVLKGSNVHTNLLKTSQRNHLKSRASFLFNFFQANYLHIPFCQKMPSLPDSPVLRRFHVPQRHAL